MSLNKIIIFFIYIFSLVIFLTNSLSTQAQTSVPPTSCFAGNDTTVYRPKVLQINFDPNITINGNTQKLRDYMRTIDQRQWPLENVLIGQDPALGPGWASPIDTGLQVVEAVREVSSDTVQFDIVDTINITDWSLELASDTLLTQEKFFSCYETDNNTSYVNIDSSTNKDAIYYGQINSPPFTPITLPANTPVTANCQGYSDHISHYIFGRFISPTTGFSTAGYFQYDDLNNIPSDLVECRYCTSDIDIYDLNDRFDICARANADEIDEVWIWGPKYGIHDATQGGYENVLITPTNSIDLRGSHATFAISECQDSVPIMINNYERSAYYNAYRHTLHYIGHRMEQTLMNYIRHRIVYIQGTESFSKVNNAIANFAHLTDDYIGKRVEIAAKDFRSMVLNTTVDGCGIIHGSPVAIRDYEHELMGPVDSNCWNENTNLGYNQIGIKTIQQITSSITSITCELWNCTGMGWQVFMLDMIPDNMGAGTHGLKNNWWEYFVNPESIRTQFEEINACTCPAGYIYDAQSGNCLLQNCNEDSTICTNSTPVCNTANGQCVECVSNNQCQGNNPYCDVSNTCQVCEGVVQGDQCTPCIVYNSSTPVYNPNTNACESCPAGSSWNGVECKQSGCNDGTVSCSGSSPYCNTVSDICVECLNDSQCGINGNCVNNFCTTCPAEFPVQEPYLSADVCYSCIDAPTPDPRFCPTSCPSGETIKYDPVLKMYACKPTTCGDDVTVCGGNTPWCSEGECKACPDGANWSSATKTCLYCADDEYFNGNECLDRHCSNNTLQCSGDKPYCDIDNDICVECNEDSECGTGHCSKNRCVECGFNENFNPITNQCETCPTGTVWHESTSTCEIYEVCSGTGNVCNPTTMGTWKPFCDDATDSICVQCNTDIDCQSNDSIRRLSDRYTTRPYCVQNTCQTCPANLPNYNFETGQCEAACTNPQFPEWNGYQCITQEKFDISYFYGPVPNSPFEPNCPIEKPYTAIDESITAYRKNLEYFSSDNPNFTLLSICMECTDNLDCGTDEPICISGLCSTCPVDSPLYNPNTLSCEKCPVSTPMFNKTTNSCEACPSGTTWNNIALSCTTNNCNLPGNECPVELPICTTSGTCVQCISSTQCGGAYPVCDNNLCINCQFYDPINNVCIPPNDAVDNTGYLVWNGQNYEQPSCDNDGIICADGLLCDSETNTCVDCFIDEQCSDIATPICNLATNSCESCPNDTPYWGVIYTDISAVGSEGTLTDLLTLTNLTDQLDTPEEDMLQSELVEVTYGCQACPTGTTWDGTTCKVINCTNGLVDCSALGLVCDMDNGKCVECTSNSQCGSPTPFCSDSGSCELCPTDTPFFNSITNSCEACSDGLVWFNGQCIAEDILKINGQVLFSDTIISPIQGNEVNLIGTDYHGEDVNLSDTTDENGVFTFENLVPGNYEIVEIQQMQFKDGEDIPGTIGGDVSINDVIAQVELRGFSSLNNLFYETGHKISGYVLFDRDGSSTMSISDSGIENVEIQITGIDDLNNAVNLSVYTQADGSFEFSNLRPGVYEINEVQPVSFMDGADIPATDASVISNDKIGSLILFDEDIVDNVFLENGWSIKGNTLFDSDLSNTYTSVDAGIPNISVNIQGTDVFGFNINEDITTDNLGLFVISNLAPGVYTLTESQPVNFIDGDDIPGTNSVLSSNDTFTTTISNASSENNYFLELGFNLSGYVLYDLDNNQIPNVWDIGIQNNEVVLTGVDILNQSIMQSIYTELDGIFSFTNLAPGTYQIEQIQLPAYNDGPDIPAAGANIVANDIIGNIIISNTNVAENYFLENGWSISGHVFLDNERDKDYDGKEKLLDGITLELRDENNKPITPNDLEIGGIFDPIVEVTDDGYYEFTNIPNGTYFVVQHQPDEYGSTTTNKIKVTVFNSNVDNIDFGEKGGVIRGYLFGDENGNGKIDGNEEVFDDVEIIITGPQDYKEKIRTNENGQFRVRGLEKGKYKISIPKYGFEMTINIDAGEEELNILIDLLPYILSSNLEQTGMDFRPTIVLTSILALISLLVQKI